MFIYCSRTSQIIKMVQCYPLNAIRYRTVTIVQLNNNCSSIYQSIVVYYYRVSFNSAGQVDILDRLAILACLTISSNNNICITTISHYNNHLNNISSHLKLLLSPSMDAPFIHTSGWYYIGWYYIGLCKLAFVFSNFWSF